MDFIVDYGGRKKKPRRLRVKKGKVKIRGKFYSAKTGIDDKKLLLDINQKIKSAPRGPSRSFYRQENQFNKEIKNIQELLKSQQTDTDSELLDKLIKQYPRLSQQLNDLYNKDKSIFRYNVIPLIKDFQTAELQASIDKVKSETEAEIIKKQAVLNKEKEKSLAEVNKLRDDINKEKQAVRDARDALAKAKADAKISADEKELAERKHKLEVARSELDIKQKELERKVYDDKLREESLALSRAKADSDRVAAELERELTQFKYDKETADRTLAQAREDLAMSNAEVANVNRELAKSQLSVRRLQEEINKINRNLEQGNLEKREADAQLKQVKSELNSKINEVKEANERASALEKRRELQEKAANMLAEQNRLADEKRTQAEEKAKAAMERARRSEEAARENERKAKEADDARIEAEEKALAARDAKEEAEKKLLDEQRTNKILQLEKEDADKEAERIDKNEKLLLRIKSLKSGYGRLSKKYKIERSRELISAIDELDDDYKTPGLFNDMETYTTYISETLEKDAELDKKINDIREAWGKYEDNPDNKKARRIKAMIESLPVNERSTDINRYLRVVNSVLRMIDNARKTDDRPVSGPPEQPQEPAREQPQEPAREQPQEPAREQPQEPAREAVRDEVGGDSDEKDEVGDDEAGAGKFNDSGDEVGDEVGDVSSDVTNNFQLRKFAKKIDGFIDVVHSDEIKNYVDDLLDDTYSRNYLIYNTNKRGEDKIGHWCLIGTQLDGGKNGDNTLSLYHYDPLGEKPSAHVDEQLRAIAEEYPYKLEYKINTVPNQDDSELCGYHCLSIMKKLDNGVPWAVATGYYGRNTEEYEKSADRLKNHLEEYGYI